MKILPIFIIASMFIMTACSQDHIKLAEQYNLELRYYINSAKFSDLNMTQEAFVSCNRTEVLRSECFTTLAQDLLIKKEDIKEEICNSIIPKEKMRMTEEAFQLVYPEQDANLEAELKEKLKPSKERKLSIAKIKEECYKRT